MRPQTNNPPRYDFVPGRPDVNSRVVVPQPQYIPRNPDPVVINPRPNVLPANIPPSSPNAPGPAEPLAENSLPYDPTGLALMGDDEYRQLHTALDESIAADVADLGTVASDLGVSDDAKVQEALEVIKKQVADGEPATDEAIEAYEKALEEAVADKNGMLTDGDIKRIAKLTEDLQTRSEIAVMFDVDYPSDPFDPVLPSDQLQLAIIPGLPPGQILYLPSGGLVTGPDAGGQLGFIETTTADLLGLPVGPSDASFSEVSDDSSGIRIYNPPETNATVSFTLDGDRYSLEADRWQHVFPHSSCEIQFDPANGRSPIRYSLTDGTYVFSGAGGKWSLAARKFKLVMENKGHDSPFHYTANGAAVDLAPGATQEHTGIYPIVIRFNRGKDGEDAK